MNPVPLPTGTRLVADQSLRRREQGRLLIGGTPMRMLRLSDAGARVVTTWLDGTPVGRSPGATALARRLLSAGMVHPDPPPLPATTASSHELTIVIPVKDDPAGLAATLATLGPLPIVVVDDGSDPPVTNISSPRRQLIRRDASGGPGVARQEALALVTTPLVTFIDASVIISDDQLLSLRRWFADPEVVAVAPRVTSPAAELPKTVLRNPPNDRSGGGSRWVARYEESRSPLDLGATPSLVGPGRPVAYVPTACLMARTADVAAAGGFDPALRWGEDVDLVWRLGRRGQVRYDPSVVVSHPPRRTLGAFVAQRLAYGSSAGPLAQRHGPALAPVRVSGWSLLVWGLLLRRQPALAGLVVAGTAAALARKLAPVVPDNRVEAAQLTVQGHLWAGRSLAKASVRDWWPLVTATAIAVPGLRRPLGLLAASAWADRIASSGGTPTDRTRDWLLGTVDDLAYGAGVWLGALRQRSARCLLPRTSGTDIETT